MGVSGLLPLLKSIHKYTSLKAYSGQTLGVDAFGWLHRGAVACSFQLAFDKPTTQYVAFVVNRVRMLLDFGITPYLVFDGDFLPSKAGTNAKRRKDREAAKELGLSLYRSGKKEQAFQELQKAVTVTPQMIFTLIEELRRMNVQILVAPYEADAQLTYLEREGIIDGILSEDSDLLVFGAKKLITKLDQYGSCIEINRSDFILNKEISFAGWSDTMFRRMAILSGCDYLPSVNGVGLRTAHGFVKKHKEISKIVRVMALNSKYLVPPDYIANVQDAERAFLYHRVFCPKSGRMVFLNALPPDLKEEDMPYLGDHVEPDVALGVACGDLNPKTKEPFELVTKSAKVATTRPMLQENRRQTIGGSNDLKPKRSLDTFFKPHRRPLAELDPNSLTPSPSQQRVFERNRNASWEPRFTSTAPNSAPSLRRSVTDASRPQLSSDSVPITKNSFLSKAAALSTYKPIKRQRLCSDSDEVSPSKEIKQSRFFSPNAIEQSPSLSKKVRERREKKAAFDVFSDDSVEDIMLHLENQVTSANDSLVEYPVLPELPTEESEAKEIQVVPQSSPIKREASFIDSQSSHGTTEMNAVTLESQSTDEANVKIGVNEDHHPDAFVSLLDYHIEKLRSSTKVPGTHRTFSDQSPHQQSAALASLKSTKSVAVTLTAAEISNSDESETEDLISPQHATNAKFQSLAKTFCCQSPTQQSRALRSLSKQPGMSTYLQNATSVDIKGSEDEVPPPSSQPEDEISEAEEKPVRKLDLESFRYAAS